MMIIIRRMAVVLLLAVVFCPESALSQGQRKSGNTKKQVLPPAKNEGQNQSQRQSTGNSQASQAQKSQASKQSAQLGSNGQAGTQKQGTTGQSSGTQRQAATGQSSGAQRQGAAGESTGGNRQIGNANRANSGASRQADFNSNLPLTGGNRTVAGNSRNPNTNSANSASAARQPNSNNAQPPQIIAPTPPLNAPGAAGTNERTAIEALGEDLFKELGLPDEARKMTVNEAVQLGTKLVVEERFRIPKGATGAMTAEEITEVVGKLQLFGADREVQSKEFWESHAAHGFDVAIGSFVRNSLSLPGEVRAGAPAGKIFEDAGEIQLHGLDITNADHWSLYDGFQAGKLSSQDLINVANGVNQGLRNQVGAGGAQPGNANNVSVQGSGTIHPGSGANDLPGPGAHIQRGTGGNSGTSTNQRDSISQTGGVSAGNGAAGRAIDPTSGGASATPLPGTRPNTAPGSGDAGAEQPPASGTSPGTRATTPGGSSSGDGAATDGSNTGTTPGTGQDNGQPPGSGTGGLPGGSSSSVADDDGMTAEAILGAGTYVIIQHNQDGTYSATVIESDGNGNNSVLGTETFSDGDGDGTYRGDKGGETSDKPNEGMYEGKEEDDGQTRFTYETDSGSSSSESTSSDSTTDTDTDADTDADADAGADADASDADEYQPHPDLDYVMPLAQRLQYMRALYDSLSDSKFDTAKGDKDSTPNPMADSTGGGVMYNYKDTVERPVDGTVNSAGTIPNEAIQQIQNPNSVQGGVIDPEKNKDR